MRPLEWILTQSDWCPYKKRGFRHTENCTHIEERPFRDIEGGHLQALERGLRRNQTLILDF